MEPLKEIGLDFERAIGLELLLADGVIIEERKLVPIWYGILRLQK